jgi:hypothetical protein
MPLGGALDETGLGNPANHIPRPAGMLNSSIPGRTDKLPISVKAGSYVIPSDTVSALGEGNSLGGKAVLNRLLASYAQNAPLSDQAASQVAIPIVAAGGEFVVPPEIVTAIGAGSFK